jgi:hypothetical protein
MLTNCCLEFVVVHGDRRAEIRLQEVQGLGIDLPLIALGIGLGRPQADGDRFFLSHSLRKKGQDLKKADLLLEDWNNFVLYHSHELFFLFGFHFKIKNACKHGSFLFI